MRILLDAKDLIDVVEHGRPIPLAEFRDYLLTHGSQVVLTYTNVREFVAPLASDGEFLKMRALLQGVESLPLRYINEAKIQFLELLEARDAFAHNREYADIDPYVKRWDQTFSLRPTELDMLVNVRIDEMVYALWKTNPERLLFPRAYSDGARRQISSDRALPVDARRPAREVFTNSVGKHLSRFGVSVPDDELARLGPWIYQNPLRCGGVRFHFECYHALRNNSQDALRDNDVSDFSYFWALPHVDAITVDRRMANYTKGVARRLHKLNARINYEGKIYPSLKALLESSK